MIGEKKNSELDTGGANVPSPTQQLPNTTTVTVCL